MTCRSANAAYQHEYRRLKAQGKQPLGARVSAKDAWRTIRDMRGEFETRREMAHCMGWKDRHIQIGRKAITLRTLLKIRRFYRETIADSSTSVAKPIFVVSPVTKSAGC